MLRVFEISRMTNKNGPGIRTLVHFKGCPLRCIWCSTPESQERHYELQLRSMRCIKEYSCIDICPQQAIHKTDDPDRPIQIDRKKCDRCFKCVNVCHAHALEKCGHEWDVSDMVYEIEKDKIFFQYSGGGVVFTGGEPLMFVDDDMVELYKRVHDDGISIGVDTTGYVPWESIEKVLPYVDYFLWDLKCMDDGRHKQFTGVSNKLILENLKKVEALSDQYGTRVYIRCVQVPGMTDYDQNLIDTCEFLKGMNCIEEIDLLNFHHFGQKRYESIDRPYFIAGKEPLDMDVLLSKQKLVESMGFKCNISN